MFFYLESNIIKRNLLKGIFYDFGKDVEVLFLIIDGYIEGNCGEGFIFFWEVIVGSLIMLFC